MLLNSHNKILGHAKKIIETKITKRDKNEEKSLMNTKSQNSKYTKFMIKNE